MEHIQYEMELEKIYNQMGASKLMVLATSANNHTTARMMSCIIYKDNIIFQTATDLLKYKQMCENNNVALCVDNIQIEGIAHIIGSAMEDKNKKIIEVYKKYYKSSYETYSHLEKERLIEVVPIKITTWEYEDGKPYRLYIDVQNRTIRKEPYPLE
jgi:uncharacterized pyridoxamine 5'-phosphate oxidase family protein